MIPTAGKTGSVSRNALRPQLNFSFHFCPHLPIPTPHAALNLTPPWNEQLITYRPNIRCKTDENTLGILRKLEILHLLLIMEHRVILLGGS